MSIQYYTVMLIQLYPFYTVMLIQLYPFYTAVSFHDSHLVSPHPPPLQALHVVDLVHLDLEGFGQTPLGGAERAVRPAHTRADHGLPDRGRRLQVQVGDQTPPLGPCSASATAVSHTHTHIHTHTHTHTHSHSLSNSNRHAHTHTHTPTHTHTHAHRPAT